MSRRSVRWAVLIVALLAAAGFALGRNDSLRSWVARRLGQEPGMKTVAERLSMHGAAVERRIRPSFEAAGLPYPPLDLVYLAFKDTRKLEVYARASNVADFVHVLDYPVQGASGRLGPKLMEGDHQVPEGLYAAEFLNPNSRFHVSIKLGYPNAFDRKMGEADGRANLGGDIMIHGGSASVGCLAMGDEAAEDLFVLAALVTKRNLKIVVSPTDFRLEGAKAPELDLPWAKDLYAALRAELSRYSRRR